MYPARRDSPPTTVITSWVGATLYDDSKVSQSPSNSNRRASSPKSAIMLYLPHMSNAILAHSGLNCLAYQRQSCEGGMEIPDRTARRSETITFVVPSHRETSPLTSTT